MASEGTRAVVVPRDGDSSGNGNLTTGAIAGIACGAGALFLGAAGLFLIYWRRQRQFNREDDEGDRFDERRAPGATAPVVTYTLDYKMDDTQQNEADQASSYTYSPEKPSYPFSPLAAADTAASAMPTHPAYIPRAFVRGPGSPGSRSGTTTSPPPIPSPPLGSSSTTNPKNKADDTLFLASLEAAKQQSTSSSPAHNRQESLPRVEPPNLPPTGLPNHPRPTHVPPMAIPSFTTTSSSDANPQSHPHHQRQPSLPFPQPPPQPTTTTSSSHKKPRAYLPPRLNLSVPLNTTAPTALPLPGKENTTISGPLAFPQHYQGPSPPGHGQSGFAGGETDDDMYGDAEDTDNNNNSNRRWSFRGRGEKKGRRKSNRDSRDGGAGPGNRHYAEIEVGRGSDIW